MQRREQQKRTAAGLGSGSSYLGGGTTGYASVARFEAPEFLSSSAARTPQSSTPVPARAPAFKGTGMKLGSKKTKQAELLDALGGDALAPTDLADVTPVVAPAPAENLPSIPVPKTTGRGSLPVVEEKGYVVQVDQLLVPFFTLLFQRSFRHKRDDLLIVTTGWRCSVYGIEGGHELASFRSCPRPTQDHPCLASNGLCCTPIQTAPQCCKVYS